MKASRWFVLFILFFLLLMFSIEYHLPKKFVWSPTYAHNDEQPFGCALFDSLLSVSLPGKYALTQRTLYQLEQDSVENKGILVIGNRLQFTQSDVNALLKLVERGNRVMLASTQYSKLLEDTLHFYCTYSFFQAKTFQKQVVSVLQKDTLCWIADSQYTAQTYRFPPSLCASCFRGYDSLQVRPLAVKQCTDVVALTRQWGKGSISLVSTPLLFTNYGVMNEAMVHYVFRLLAEMKGLPMLRTEAYVWGAAQKQQSPFRYLLAHRPLRAALYLTVLTVLLFMFFTAKRKQRVIPVIEVPQNKSLEFIERMGTLYFQRQDHADLVRKKFQYMAEELRREVHLDVEEAGEDARTMAKLAHYTGMEVEELMSLFKELRSVVYTVKSLEVSQMKMYIDKMNEIMRRI